MPRKKSMQLNEVAKAFFYTSGGFAGMCIFAMIALELLPDSQVDFGMSDYALPLALGPSLASGVIAIEGGLSLAEQTRLGKWFKQRARRRGPIYAPAASRAISVNRTGGGSRGKVFALSLPFNLSLVNRRDTKPFDYDNPAQDSGIKSQRIAHLDPDAFEWTVWLTGKIVPITREQPILIHEELLLNFLKLAYKRQQETSTKNSVFSRVWFTNTEKFCSVPTYNALIGLADTCIYGRKEGLSGYLIVRPQRALIRVKTTYPNYSIIEV